MDTNTPKDIYWKGKVYPNVPDGCSNYNLPSYELIGSHNFTDGQCVDGLYGIKASLPEGKIAYVIETDPLPSSPKEEGGTSVEQMAEAYADTKSYQSDKEVFETTPWAEWNLAKEGFISGYTAALSTYNTTPVSPVTEQQGKSAEDEILAEEILNKHWRIINEGQSNHLMLSVREIDGIVAAMIEYRNKPEQKVEDGTDAIKFAEWVEMEGYRCNTCTPKEFTWYKFAGKPYTTQELYTLYQSTTTHQLKQ